MKRLMIGIGAVLYLAACWAPQLWTGTADAQEKPKEPEVLDEVRAQRFVLVDEDGGTLATLTPREEGGAQLVILGDDGARAHLGVVGTSPALVLVEHGADDTPSRLLLCRPGSAHFNAGSASVSVSASGDPKAGASVTLKQEDGGLAKLGSCEFGAGLAFQDSNGVKMADIGSWPMGLGGYVSLRGKSHPDAEPVQTVLISSGDLVAGPNPIDSMESLEEHARGVVRTGLKLSFGDEPSISITSAKDEEEQFRAVLDATRLAIRSDGQTRAQIGKVETVNKRTGAETTQEGAFASYDADGNVLWMEPK